MNRDRLFLLLLVFALLWYLLKEPEPSPKSEEAHAPRPSAAAPKRSSPLAAKAQPRPPPTSAAPSEVSAPEIRVVKPQEAVNGPIQAPPNSVPFDLINNYVVAYGDILIGRPGKENFPNHGFIEAPKMQTWDSNEIPFSLHNTLKNPERVLKTIQYFNTHTPIRFVPYSGQDDSIVFMPSEDLCLSYLGRIRGNQPIYLSEKCGEREIAHEILHALGFIHEQSRPDRDRYIRILWPNIIEEHQDQFVSVPDALFEPFWQRPFDYRSIMLYPPDAFAKQPGTPTLESLGQAIDPAPTGLSDEDLARLWMLYN